MAHKFNPAQPEKLDTPARRALLAPAETLAKLGFCAGQTLADIGCGTGLFSLEAAKSAGRVYAADIAPQMLAIVKERAAAAGFANVVPVLAEEYDFHLPNAAADLVLACAVLHETDDKTRWLREAARVCKPGGHAAVIEFEPAFTGMGPPAAHRLPETQVAALLQTAGFTSVRRFALSGAFYAVLAARA